MTSPFIGPVSPTCSQIPGIGDDVRARLLRGTRRWPTADGRVAPLGRAIRRLRGPRRIVSDYSGPGPEHPAIDAAAWWFGYWQRLEYAQPVVGRLAEALELEDARSRRSSSGSTSAARTCSRGGPSCPRSGSQRRSPGLSRVSRRPASGSGRTIRSGVEPSSTSAGRSRSPTTGPPLRHMREMALLPRPTDLAQHLLLVGGQPRCQPRGARRLSGALVARHPRTRSHPGSRRVGANRGGRPRRGATRFHMNLG